MLDLQPRVHLDEVEGAGFCDELDGAGAYIADCARRGHRRYSHRASLLRIEAGRRRLLQHLLMPPLDRAVALEQMDRVAVPVGENLDFDVARPLQVFFDQHAVIAKGRCCLPLCPGERRSELRRAADDPHPAPPPRRGFDQDRKPIRSASSSRRAGSCSSP
jgi:hypothetical protein